MGRKDVCLAVTVMLMGSLLNFASGVTYYGMGLLTTPIVELYNVTRFEAAWIPSLYAGALFGFGVPAVVAIDIFGYAASMVVGIIIAIACLFGVTASPSIGLSYALFGITGCAAAIMDTGSVCFISIYFEKWREFGFAISSFGGGIGSFVGPVVLATILNSYGMNAMLYALGAMMALLLPAALIFHLSNPQRKEAMSQRRMQNRNEALNRIFTSIKSVQFASIPSINHRSDAPSTHFRDMRFARSISAVYIGGNHDDLGSVAVNATKRFGGLATYFKMFLDVRVTILSAGWLLYYMGTSVVFLLTTDLMIQYFHSEVSRAAYPLVGAGIGSLVGRGASIGLSFLTYNRPLALAVQIIIHGAAIILYPYTNLETVTVLTCLFGISEGYATSLTGQLHIDYFGDTNLPKHIGITYTFIGIGSMIGAPIAGSITDNYSYLEAYAFGGVSTLLGGVLLAVLAFHPETRRRMSEAMSLHRKNSQSAEVHQETVQEETSKNGNGQHRETLNGSERMSIETNLR